MSAGLRRRLQADGSSAVMPARIHVAAPAVVGFGPYWSNRGNSIVRTIFYRAHKKGSSRISGTVGKEAATLRI
ncbi:hypothetical protein [Salinisphaera sp. S4-8]|uniref:hypothetical protein n=1 Tax=Salinisphaera sp. S4-8 TaxID=633357 RepID=UPI00333EEB57